MVCVYAYRHAHVHSMCTTASGVVLRLPPLLRQLHVSEIIILEWLAL